MTNDEMKKATIAKMEATVTRVRQQYDILNALDCDGSATGCYDLYDQLMTIRELVHDIESVISRCKTIVP